MKDLIKEIIREELGLGSKENVSIKEKTVHTEKPFVIVRAYTGGVHAGNLVSHSPSEVILENSIRLWQWSGGSLSQVAVSGPSSVHTNKFGEVVPKTILTENEKSFEIIFCTKKGEENIKKVSPWKN